MSNIIVAQFCNDQRAIYVRGAWEYDRGLKLQILGLDLPDVFQVHFSNTTDSGTATPVVATSNTVDIPSSLLDANRPIYAWIYLTPSEGVAYTTRLVMISITSRAAVENLEPTEEQQNALDQAIAALNEGVTRAEAAAGQAEQSAGEASASSTSAGEAATSASASATSAASSAASAAASATAAQTAQGKAEGAQEAAEAAAGQADQSAGEASTSAASAGESATGASASATSAASSAASAAASATAAQTAQGKAEDAQEAAEAAYSAASLASDSAITSKTEAAASASNAAASASGAAASATAAAGSATAAAASASNAAASEAAAEAVLESIPADYSELSADVSELKGQVTYKALNQYEKAAGYLLASLKWKYTTGTRNKHIVIPVNPGDVVAVTAGTNQEQVAFLKTYATPVEDAYADVSEQTGYTGIININAGITGNYIVPSDAHYIYLLALATDVDRLAVSVVINGIDISKTVIETIASLSQNVTNVIASTENNADQIDEIRDDVDFVFLQTQIRRGNINSSMVWENCLENAVYQFFHAEIPVTSGDKIRIIANSSTVLSYAIFLKQFSAPVNDETASPSDTEGYTSRISISNSIVYNFIVPSDCTYLYILTKNNGTDVTPAQIFVNEVDMTKSVKGNLELLHQKFDTDVVWAAMGDSITSGYYSLFEDGVPDSRYNPAYAYVTHIAATNHWKLTNLGVGGAGFLVPGSGNEPRGYETARMTDFTPYNLVTIAYGTNDWSSNSPMGSMADDPTATTITAVIPAMRATIEAVIASNPNCKIIVILPFNRQKSGTPGATEETNWALGYELSNTGTLESFVQKMIEVCNYYGIQYIDMTHYSCINRKNLATVLPDGTHPTIECHAILAHELSKKITF